MSVPSPDFSLQPSAFSLRPKAVLVTGAAGFIGRRMSVAAQAAGWRVIGLDREVSRDARPEAPDGEDRGSGRPCLPDDTPKAVGIGSGSATQSEPKPQSPAVGGPDALSLFAAHKDCEAGCVPAGTQPYWICADLTGSTPIELPPGIDAIIHLAGKAHALAEVAQDEAEYFRINTEGTRRILEAAQRAGVRAFVLFSTVKAAGDSGEVKAAGEGFVERETSGGCAAGGGHVGPPLAGVPLRGEPSPERETRNSKLETIGPSSRPGESGVKPSHSIAPLDELCAAPPDTPYGQSKRAAEALVLKGGYVPHPVVLRPCLVYGPTPKGNLEKMIAAVRRGRFPPLPEVGNKRSMVHVDDVIAVALLAAEHPAAAGQIFVVADNEPFSTRQLFEWICLAAGRRVPRWTMPLWLLRLLARVGDGIGRLRGRRFVFDSDALAKLTGNAWYSSAKLQRELGWRPKHTLKDTLGEIVGK